ncbi:TonB-dependent receptor [Panacibacter sp. DH6]|uniref:TonB-dependent receptor n=1 Tax=Panacibacter microcysteis TaxID=2793269 RepID=A0A931GV70_9BACT|nr:TonB-dependent receptor [Panacibacter microcysteis]MBG9376105.1 TonB-dependent receptor [Panacibacter microcysteis]
MKKAIIGMLVVMVNTIAAAQSSNTGKTEKPRTDTLTPGQFLPDVTVVGTDIRHDMVQMPEIVGTHIFAGKKNALVVVNNVNGNVVNNTMRQILAKVPGIHIWESDGSGIQVGISTRGLSPNRSWDFNVRQNGYDISADPFGYPEAYYNPPMQAVQRIQILKGAGALQFGPQMGGMLNYVLRNGSGLNKPITFESQNTVGSFGMINTFNAIGGQSGKSNYYAFYDHRNADGWRANSNYKTNTGFATYGYRFTDKLHAGIEVLHYEMLSQQPGGLTDSLFNIDAQQSLRTRNWFNVQWTTAAANVDFKPGANSHFNLKLFGLSGTRNSIGFLNAITVADTINRNTGAYANRTVDIDKYKNVGAELRHLYNYSWGSEVNSLTTSVRYFRGNTTRFRNGKGNAGNDFNKDIEGVFPTELDFVSNNVAVAVENIFRINKRFLVIPALRWEQISTTANGRVGYTDTTEIKLADNSKSRGFLLPGAAAEYHLGTTEFYANFTGSYRPIQFADLSANATTDVVDPDLRDAKGYNIDFGYRGKLQNYLYFDAGVYYLNYRNRIGTITQMREDGSTYNYSTNVGNSHSKGFEGLIEFNPFQANWLKKTYGEVALFVSYAYTDAKYDDFKVITKASDGSLAETNLRDKRVENAPRHILRTGLTYFIKGFSLTAQLSHVSSAYSDANNTTTPSAAATTGLIPAYTVVDVALTYRFLSNYNIKAGINNLADVRYFTRRAGGYPGPGLMPSDARNCFVSFGIKI